MIFVALKHVVQVFCAALVHRSPDQQHISHLLSMLGAARKQLGTSGASLKNNNSAVFVVVE